MKAILKRAGKNPQVIDIDNRLETLQEAVGGYIEYVRIDEEIIMLCDECGKLKDDSVYNFHLGRDCIVGDVLFVQSNGEDFADLSEKNIEEIMMWFPPF